MLHGMLADLLLEERESLIGRRLELIFLLHDLAHEEDKFLLDCVGVLTDFECGRHKLVFSQLHS